MLPSSFLLIRGSELSIFVTLEDNSIISPGRLIFVFVVVQVYFYNIPDDIIDILV